MAIGGVDEPCQRILDEPCVSVQDEHVLGVRLGDTAVPPGRETAVFLLHDANLRKPLAHGIGRAVGRAVVDHDGLGAGDARQAPLDPGERVVRDDDAGDARAVVSHARAADASRGGTPPRAGSRPPAEPARS